MNKTIKGNAQRLESERFFSANYNVIVIVVSVAKYIAFNLLLVILDSETERFRF
ncbi:hypothetical protein [Aquibacillus sediminis]|uniref:hypothetical protein n=1 Tax=Aquibacillus sediminis TaxID=2574734 RepID=UPI0014862B0A|nr:hypothetical protein [Aquibacillus sediminis]